MPTYKKKRRHNKKTQRKRKRGGQNINISRITDKKTGKYLGKHITRTAEGKNPDKFNPYIEPTLDINIEPYEAKYVNSVLFSTINRDNIEQKNILVRVNNNEEEAQMKLYSEVQKVFETDKNKDNFKNKFFKNDDEKTLLTDRLTVWTVRPKNADTEANKNKYITKNKNKFPKYFEKNPTSIPPKTIDELKDDIYPLITDKIVEYFMEKVLENPETKDIYSSIYVKGETNTYNNIRYVIMHILNFINTYQIPK